jgi:putative membrane protein
MEALCFQNLEGNTMRRILPFTLLALLLSPSLTLSAADNSTARSASDTSATPTSATTLAQADIHFIQKAYLYNKVEIKAAEMALNRNLTAEEKTYTEQLMKEHKEANKELSQLANNKNVSLTETIPNEYQEKINKLGNHNDSDFSEAYLEARIDCHQKAISHLEDISEDSKDVDVRRFAQDGLVAVKGHLDTAKRLEERY